MLTSRSDYTSTPVRLSVIIPVYNERFTLERIVERVLAQEGSPGIASLQIIVVDDCSKDGSREILQNLAAKYPQILAAYHDKNQGKAGGIRTGISKADGDVILFQDADLEYDPGEYSRLLRPILEGEADVVYGSRFLVSEYRRVLYFWHYVMNLALTTLSNIFSDLNLTDMECCFKVFRAPLLKSIPIRSEGFGLEPEITAKIAKRRFRVYEVPISYKGRTYEEGKKITWKDGVWAFYYIIKYWLIDDCYSNQGAEILSTMSTAPRFNRWMADEIRPYLGNSVLEIGAGMGNLTHLFLPRDVYIASDIDPVHLQALSSRFAGNDRVWVRKIDLGDPASFAGLENHFETVLCLNVLEHLTDDLMGLRNIFNSLKPAGKAIILVPQGKHLFSNLDKDSGHYRRYDSKGLESRMREAGFAIDRLFDFNRPGLIGWGKGKLRGNSTIGKMEMKAFDHCVWIFRMIDKFLPWHGLFLVAIGKKIG
ncbi:hypothetical protein AUK22_08210 [bacterium CG2_30_54_10]|nr:MAG: hypothetical protein AUK22_08210 [bacterium CG2_30_54_10]